MSKAKKTESKKIRVLVVEPGKKPRVEQVPAGSWKAWYPLIDKSTSLFQQLHFLPNIDFLFDEESCYKDMQLNVWIPAHAPPAVEPGTFVIDTTKGRGMKPGEPGIGYHEIRGTFLIARTRGSEYTDLKDEDISKFMEALSHGRA